MKHLVLVAALAFTPGCAAALAFLPDVIAIVTDGQQIISEIERFADLFFKSHPSPEDQRRVTDALGRCRSALSVMLRAGQGAKSLDEGAVEAAFVEFRGAYLELLKLVHPMGVRQAEPVSGHPGALKAIPGGGLEVPEPVAFRPKGNR